jgi:hypothetical protein
MILYPIDYVISFMLTYFGLGLLFFAEALAENCRVSEALLAFMFWLPLSIMNKYDNKGIRLLYRL